MPVLHSAAAIKGLCEISAQQNLVGSEGGGAANVFIETLLKKRYALPFQVRRHLRNQRLLVCRDADVAC